VQEALRSIISLVAASRAARSAGVVQLVEVRPDRVGAVANNPVLVLIWYDLATLVTAWHFAEPRSCLLLVGTHPPRSHASHRDFGTVCNGRLSLT